MKKNQRISKMIRQVIPAALSLSLSASFPLGVTVGLPALALTLVASGCTKERPYEEVFKDNKNYVKDQVVDTSAVYLYVPTNGNSTRTAEAPTPYYMGDERLVKLRWTDSALEVVEVDKEGRFTDNVTNVKPVLSIPVEHVEYKCGENSVGECNNKEEENNKINWAHKTQFKPNFESMQVRDVNTLPVELENLFTGGCYHEIGARLISAKMEANAINIQIERTYNANIECVSDINWNSLNELNFSVINHYSLAKLDSVASADYEKVLYPTDDDNEIGFFKTETSKLSGDNLNRQKDEIGLLNRFNPKRGKIHYYLTENFNKPENAALKAATYESVKKINKALESAGAGIQLELHDYDASVAPGDIRYSSIVMVEDPSAAGLLGYGPSVKNPLTGEIVSARTIMYSGILRSSIRTTYEEIRDQVAKDQAAAKKGKGGAGKDAKDGAQQGAVQAHMAHKLLGIDVVSKDGIQSGRSNAAPVVSQPASSVTKISARGASKLPVSAAGIAKLKQIAESAKLDVEQERLNLLTEKGKSDKDDAQLGRLEQRLRSASQHCFYMADDVNFSEAVMKGIKGGIAGGELKPWEDLSESERESVLNAIMPAVWESVLIHEMGHNLGLRHNFKGSEDNGNFYTGEELAQMGIDHEIPYSSVMDYAGRSLNELPTMGKYDVAALRFGYARKVELVDGTNKVVGLIEIPKEKTLTEIKKGFESEKKALEKNAKDQKKEVDPASVRLVKEYGFCTDEGTTLNANCKRFDEGTNYLEIAQYQIRNYHERYRMRNFRNGAANFSYMNDSRYASRIESVFYNLRLNFEVWERLASMYPTLDAEVEQFRADPTKYANLQWLVQLKDAMKLSAEFFLDVLATPDVHCAVVPAANPTSAEWELAPLADLNSMFGTDAISCYEQDLTDELKGAGYVAVAQGGKSFHHQKSSSNPNPYADQIDVRGIWIDKILAAQYLFDRKIGVSNLDEVASNYLDWGIASESSKKLVKSILMNQLSKKVTFTKQDGEQVEVEMAYKLNVQESQLITLQRRSLRRVLRLPEQDTLFSKELVRELVTEIPHITFGNSSSALKDAFSIRDWNNGSSLKPADNAKLVTVSGKAMIALPENEMAVEVITTLNAVKALETVGKDKAIEILKALAGVPDAKMPELKSDAEKAVAALSADMIADFLSGKYESSSYYETLLTDVLARI